MLNRIVRVGHGHIKRLQARSDGSTRRGRVRCNSQSV